MISSIWQYFTSRNYWNYSSSNNEWSINNTLLLNVSCWELTCFYACRSCKIEMRNSRRITLRSFVGSTRHLRASIAMWQIWTGWLHLSFPFKTWNWFSAGFNACIVLGGPHKNKMANLFNVLCVTHFRKGIQFCYSHLTCCFQILTKTTGPLVCEKRLLWVWKWQVQ